MLLSSASLSFLSSHPLYLFSVHFILILTRTLSRTVKWARASNITRKINQIDCFIGSIIPSLRSANPVSLSSFSDLAIRNYYPESVAIGTSAVDNHNPALCRMVYFGFTNSSRFKVHQASIATNGYKYDEPTKSKQKDARGAVPLRTTHLFQDLWHLQYGSETKKRLLSQKQTWPFVVF